MNPKVLFLILMENTFWVSENPIVKTYAFRLNPYFNGKYFLSHSWVLIVRSGLSLNPYFNGKYFLRISIKPPKPLKTVLILILMENTFWALCASVRHQATCSLNPYFNGKYFLSLGYDLINNFDLYVLILILMENTFWALHNPNEGDEIIVLILILMENTFWESFNLYSKWKRNSLNPYFNGKYFLRTRWKHYY